MPEGYQIFPIGTIVKQERTVAIELESEFCEGLLGLEEFSHILVFFWFHQNDSPKKRRTLRVHPRGDRQNPLTGVFATRSPARPNLIGLSTCKILSIRGNLIYVDAIDAFHGSPVIDIKPCIAREDLISEVRVPAWVETRPEEKVQAVFSRAAPPGDSALMAMAEKLIQQENTMTLATARGVAPWAAPVYYVCLKPAFYFFSDPASRHIQEALASGAAASAIYAAASSWEGIRGVQMEGEVRMVSPGTKALEVVKAYLKKFSFTKEFFQSGEPLDLSAFARRFRVRLYAFTPTLFYYLDNQIHFGFRKRLPWYRLLR